MRVVRFLLVTVVVLVALALGAGWYLTRREPVPEVSDYALDMSEIRKLAGASAGALPERVNHEQIGVGLLPKGAVFAGESLSERQPMSHGAYQVVYADGTFAMIDSAFDAAMLHTMNPEAEFSESAWTAIQRGLGAAKVVVITHEHADHIGGIARFAEPDKLVGRVQLSEEQLGSKRWLAEAAFPESLEKGMTPLRYERYHVVAPGIVVIKAPGHTPGSQMVFVKLANGKELLFLGDVAWHMSQIRELWYRPRLVTWLFLGENRAQVMAEFRTLHDLISRDSVQLVVSHDTDQRRELIAAGVLGEQFQF